MSHVCALCAGRNVDSVRMFLRHRATVDVVDKNGISLMHVAAMAGNPGEQQLSPCDGVRRMLLIAPAPLWLIWLLLFCFLVFIFVFLWGGGS